MDERIFKRVLITGISGSGGSYLADYIIEHFPKVSVHGISRWHSTTSNSNLSNSKNRVFLHECDLNDLSSTTRILQEVKPDAIFHLASHANVRASFITPLSVLQNNILGTANLFEAIRISKCSPIIQLASTSEVYGQVEKKDVPIKESCSLNPASPYAVSKVAQDLLGRTYFLNFALPVIRTRMFTYINPRRKDLFATSFAMQVARIEKGLQKELLHGNLNSVRTIIDVRDAMSAYWAATTRGKLGEVYNIGGTTVITVEEFLNMLKKLAKVRFTSRVDKALLRPTDVTLQVPDVSKFRKETGWKPRYKFEESVQFLLDTCRREIEKECNK